MIYPDDYTQDMDVKTRTKVELITHLCEELHSDITKERFRDKIEIKTECELLQDVIQSLLKLDNTLKIYEKERRK